MENNDPSGHVDYHEDPLMTSLGYRQSLARNLHAYMNWAFGFTEVSVFASLVSSMGIALAAGGAPMMVWSWVVGATITTIVGFSMAEICSAYPSAGSVYHWAGNLSSERSAPGWSYVTGWLNFIGNSAGDASFASGWAALLNATLIAHDYDALNYKQLVGVSIGILFVWSILNFFRVDRIGWINNTAAVFQIVSIVGIAVWVLVATPHWQSASFVFVDGYYNGTGFDNSIIILVIGMLTTLFSFSGYEASAHMAEETHDSETSAPMGLIVTCIGTAVFGFVLIVPMLFAMPPLSIALYGQDGSFDGYDGDIFPNTRVAAVHIFLYAAGRTGGRIMAIASVINLFFAGVSSVTVTSRITYALIRDKAFPFSDFLSGVSGKTKSPVKPIVFNFLVDAVILLLPLTSETNGAIAFSAIVAMTVFGFQVSYGIPILLRITAARNDFRPAKFSLGRLCVPFGIISCIWLFGTSCFLFFPTQYPVTGETMNYACAVLGVIVFIAAVYWAVRGHKTFTGPQRSGIKYLELR